MRVSIKHVTKFQGFILREELYGVEVTVAFSELEKALIKHHGLGVFTLVERPDMRPGGENPVTTYLTVSSLLRGTDSHFLRTPVQAKIYADEVVEAITTLRYHLNDLDTEPGDLTFET